MAKKTFSLLLSRYYGGDLIKHSAFSLTDISASDMPAILKKFVSNEATSEAAILGCTWQPGRVYVTSFRPTRNWRQGEKPGTDVASFTRSAKSIFSMRFSTSLYPILSFRSLEHVCLKIKWLKNSHNRVEVKIPLAGGHLDKLSWAERHYKNAACLLSTVQNGGNDVEF